MRDTLHLCYHADMNALIETYIAVNHFRDVVVAVHNPSDYVEYLSSLGLIFDKTDIYFDKIMIVQLSIIEDGISLIKSVDPSIGPICSLWADGKKVTDNIEENL